MNKRGTILVENIVFLILNLLFLSLLVLFLLRQGNGAIVLEESYSKQIAMVIDSAKPVMIIQMDMEKARKLTQIRGIDFANAVQISGNVVKVKLTQNSGYSYSFFNDVDVSARAIKDSKGDYTGMYLFVINERGNSNE